jgi:beta-lactamase class A
VTEHSSWYKRHALLLIFGLVALGLLFFGLNNQTETSASSVEPVYQPSDSAQQDALGSDQVNPERLKSIAQGRSQGVDTAALDSEINTIINNNPDIIIGVSIEDIATGAIYNYGDQAPMTAASVTKVLTAIDYMKQVELGNRSLSTIMVDGNSAQYDIEQMIVVSDNNAWHVLNDNLGYSQLQSYADSIGLTTYYYGDNTINASDTSKMLANLYKRTLINESHTELLLSYMERANYRDLIIPAVPEHDTVYHKAGSLYAYLHDATIITNSTDTISLTIFTNSLYSFDKARTTSIMQQITAPTLAAFGLE